MNDYVQDSKLDQEISKKLIALTRDLILIPGTTLRPDDLLRSLKWIGNHLEFIEGTEVVYYEHHGVHSLVAKPVGCEVPEVMMCSHVDVVHHADVSVYKSHLDDGLLWGPGAGDMKANVVMTMEVYRKIQEEQPGAPIAIAVTTDEEIGGENGMGYLFGEGEEGAGVRCVSAMVPDGGSVDRVVTREKGVLQVKLTTSGKAGHASRPWLSSNAVERLLDGIYHFQEKFMKEFPPSEDHWHSTFVTTIIGTTNSTSNRIPDDAHASLDFRFIPPMTPQGMEAYIAENLDPGISHEVVVSADSTILNPDQLYFEVTEEVIGEIPDRERSDGASDARFIAQHGIPVIITRPVCGNLHCTDEWLDIKSYAQLYHIYYRYLKKRLELLL